MSGLSFSTRTVENFTEEKYETIADFIANNASDEFSVVCYDFRMLLNKENIASHNKSLILEIYALNKNGEKLCAVAMLEYKNDSYEILCLISDTNSDINNKWRYVRRLLHELYLSSDKIIYQSEKIREYETKFRDESILRVKKSIPINNGFYVMSCYTSV